MSDFRVLAVLTYIVNFVWLLSTKRYENFNDYLTMALGFSIVTFIPVSLVVLLIRDSIMYVYDVCYKYRCTTDKTYYKNGQLKSKIPYKWGKKHGIEKWYYENGQIKFEIPYINGERNGIKKWYYENGQLKSEISENGLEKSYYENGQLKSEILYNYGKIKGCVKLYNPDGKLMYNDQVSNDIDISYYKNGNIEIVTPMYRHVETAIGKRKVHCLVGWDYEDEYITYEYNYKQGIEKSYYENGQLKSEIPYSFIHKHGIEESYYDGSFKRKISYYSSDKNGIEKSYYENGHLKSEISYENGIINGVEKWYDENGNETKHQNYVKGYKANDDGVLYESEYHRMLMDKNEELREQLKKQADNTEA